MNRSRDVWIRFVPNVSTTTQRRLRYASGYIDLGMLKAASQELDTIEGIESMSPEVLSVRADLYMAARDWNLLVAVARDLARDHSSIDKGWIYWAYALRELGRVNEAQTVLLEAEPILGKTSIVLHHNLACYSCLLGDREEAIKRLRMVFEMDKSWKAQALEDPDLASMRNVIEEME